MQRYGAALLALSGVFVLFLPVLRHTGSVWIGEVLALAASVLWTHFGRECRALGADLSGAEVSAQTMWRAGVWMMPVAGVELWQGGLVWRTEIVLIQLYCVVFGGVVAFAIWNNGLRHWPTSRVLLFNNLIPLSTATWAHFCLGEPMTPTFWVAMALIVGGVGIGQAKWQRTLSPSTVPPE